jgi:hypothetical protein
MKVLISNYRDHWISPYTILKTICFWEKDDDVFYNHEEIPNHKYDKWVNRLDPICVIIKKVLDFIHPRINYVKIDRWDTWSFDHSLAQIILPGLKQLKDTKHGSPQVVNLEDVPKELRYFGHEDYESQSCFEFYHENENENSESWDSMHKRWEWILDEMIFAFEHHLDDSWEDEFRSGELDKKFVPCAWDENGKVTMYEWVNGPEYSYKCDYDGIRKVYDRMNNGFRLFGVYYRNLWT